MMIETDRLFIREFTPEMAGDVCRNSLDDDNRRFVPDEVFETEEEARDAIAFLMSQYGKTEGPLTYPVFTKNGVLRPLLVTKSPNRRTLQSIINSINSCLYASIIPVYPPLYAHVRSSKRIKRESVPRAGSRLILS